MKEKWRKIILGTLSKDNVLDNIKIIPFVNQRLFPEQIELSL